MPPAADTLLVTLDGRATGADQGCRVVDLVDQLERRFVTVELDPTVVTATPEVLRAAIHQAVQHLEPGGWMSVDAAADAVVAPVATELGLERRADDDRVMWRRTTRTTVHDLVHEARRSIGRLSPHDLHAALAGPTPPWVVDTRTHTDLERTGVIAGSAHVPRTVLEWHLDPANGYRHPDATGFDQHIVVVCNGGYSSSLAAANLVRLGFTRVADLIGGIHAWQAAGLPLVPPDHTHLDLSIAVVLPD